MAQTSYTPISLYYSTTASATPTAGNLVNGELAINITDGKIFYKDNSGVVQVIATKGGVGTSSTTQVLYNNAGLISGASTFTFNGTTVTLANDASISGLAVGKGGGAVSTNTAFGTSAIAASASGTYDTGVGYQSLNALTSGNYNTSIGGQSLQKLTTGSNNSAVGVNALQNVVSGSYNSAVGFNALAANTGNYNSALGDSALVANTSGAYNTAVGQSALQANTTASNNTAVGYQAGYSNTTGYSQAIFGYQAGYTNSTGVANTFIGNSAGYSATGGYNTFIGQSAGDSVSSGAKNTILGRYSGNQGGLDIRTASNYIVLSDGDGNPRVTVNSLGTVQATNFNGYTGAASTDSAHDFYSNAANVVLGLYNSHASTPYGLYINYASTTPNNTSQYFIQCVDPTNSKFIVYSNGTVTNRTGTYNAFSDAKLKENIVDATSKLDDVMKLRVRNFNLIGDDLKQIGFIAQELEQVFPNLVENTPDIEKDAEGNHIDLGTVTKQVKTSVLVPILVKAIQELKAEVDSLKQQLGK